MFSVRGTRFLWEELNLKVFPTWGSQTHGHSHTHLHDLRKELTEDFVFQIEC